MDTAPLTQGELLRLVAKRLLVVVPLLLAMLFVPAGTLDYWQAWLYLAVLFAPLLFVLRYLIKNEPELLERRMRYREPEPEQKRIMGIGNSVFILINLIPGLDRRFGWSDVPVPLVLAADVLVLLAYGFVFLVFRENAYASRVISVDAGQKVISSGPYAFVRHPMYLGSLVLYIASGLALGSYWATLAATLITITIVLRIRNEESVLVRDLPGYDAYRQRVHYRLVPGVW